MTGQKKMCPVLTAGKLSSSQRGQLEHHILHCIKDQCEFWIDIDGKTKFKGCSLRSMATMMHTANMISYRPEE